MTRKKTGKQSEVKAQATQPWWETEGVWDAPAPHEPMAFVIRRGGCSENVEEEYDERFNDETADAIAAAGYNYVETVFFKGLASNFSISSRAAMLASCSV